MPNPIYAIVCAALVTACSPMQSGGDADSTVAVSRDSSSGVTSAAPGRIPGESDPLTGNMEFMPPTPARDLNDMIAGCPGMNPQNRPRGSNCFGIFPEQCGADRAAQHEGEMATPDLRDRIISYAPNGDVRFINPGDAVIQDLRYGRLNIHLDKAGLIEEADCY